VEPRPEMMIMMNILEGLSWGESMGGGEPKERILRGAESGSSLHVYKWRQHNETHQTLWKKGKWEKEDGNKMEGVNLFKVHGTLVWNFTSPPPHIINV
jgi:hypothetical protein